MWIHDLTKDEFEQFVDAYINHDIDAEDFEAFLMRWVDEQDGEFYRVHEVTAEGGEERRRYPEE